MNEPMNVFERRQPRGTLADDRKTRFAKLHERRSAALRESNTLEDRVERNAAQRASWSGDARAGGLHTASGVSLDADTARLKAAAAESRKPRPVPSSPPTAMTITAIILQWERNTPGYYRSAFNAENMKNFLLTNVAAGKLDWSYEALDTAYRWLDEHGYLEAAPRPRKRGDYAAGAPKVFPAFVSDAERATEDEAAHLASAQRTAREVERALAMDFGTLQRQVRGALPAYGAEAVR